MWGNFCQSPLKFPLIAHRHLCLDMSEGEGLISILKIWIKKKVFDRMFLKHMNNIVV